MGLFMISLLILIKVFSESQFLVAMDFQTEICFLPVWLWFQYIVLLRSRSALAVAPHGSVGRLHGLLVYLPWGHFVQDRTQALQRHHFQEENYWCYGSEMITPWKWIAFWWGLVAFAHKEKPRGFLKPWTDRTIFQKSTFGKLSPWSASDLDIFHISVIQCLCTDKAVWGI